MSTQQQRQEWRELAAAATPGEWHVKADAVEIHGSPFNNPGVWSNHDFVTFVCDCGTGDGTAADAAFIAAARAAVPALLADVDALTQEVARLMEAGRDMQEQRDGWRQECEQARTLARNEGAAHGDTIIHNMYLRDELAKVQQERDAAIAQIASLENIIDKQDRDITALQNAAAANRQERDALAAELERVRAQVADYIRQENEAADDERYNNMFRAPMFDDTQA